MRWASIIAVVAAAAVAGGAEPAAADSVRRIALVNPTPELIHAAAAALAPWHIEVVDAGAPAVDTGIATTLAHDRGADRIAWLDAGELVVLDPSTGISERRPAPDGAADPAAAAAVALSIKTVLRLPAPEPTPAPVPEPAPDRIDVVPIAPVAPSRGVVFAPAVAGGIRIPVDGTLASHPRIELSLGVVLPRWPAWRPAIVAAYAPAVGDVGRAGLQGEWSDAELGLRLAVALRLGGAWSLVPSATVTAHLVHITGRLPPQEDLDELDAGGSAGGELMLWWSVGRFGLGVGGGAGVWFALSDYSRSNVMVFDSPRVMAQAQAGIRVDL